MATPAAAAQDLADLLADYQRHYHPLDDWFYEEELAQCEPGDLFAYLLPQCYGLWDDAGDPLEIVLSLHEPLRLLAVLALDDVTGANGLSADVLAAEYPELALTLPAGWPLDPALTALRGCVLAPPFDGLADVLAYLTRQTGSDLLDLSPADLLSYGELPPCDLPTAERLRAEYCAIQPTLDALAALTAWHAAYPDPAAAHRRLLDLLLPEE